ncbi:MULTISPECIES: spinster family MFS transporter [unclassified Sphingomonas]|uniref:spinster family MFS transporter n=1 Tax=unclassified Sphingomonas TaxID=196159 RepID=UPI0006FA768F|nr:MULTISPECIES: MFS transporter [unclassified Sphingomonas]KQX18587.1 hypothetical protein ASD17_15700 [Sphingomonas sp. Root1294]KQY72089.1 hypothetical protein ASD39_19275 [Sphingomonas sp. Root50]KRB94641.1 hypothetical protein ASE22_01480 [Sphingomonas sp. Root720]
MAVFILLLCQIISYVDRSAVSVLLPEIKKEFGASDAELGLLSGLAFTASYALVGLWVARVADRGNRRNIIALAVLVWSVMTALTGGATSFLILLLARIGVGAGESGCVPPTHSMFADMFPLKERVAVLSIYSAGQPLGAMIGLSLGGWLSQIVGWRETFYIFGVAGVLLVPIVLMWVSEPQRSHSAAAPGSSNIWADLKLLFGRKSYAYLLAGLAFSGFPVGGLVAWLPSFYARTFHVGVGEIGTYFGLAYGIGSMTGILIGGLIATPLVVKDTRWALFIPIGGYIVASPFILASLFVPSFHLAVGLLFIGFAILTSGFGSVYALIQTVVPSTLRALAVALTILASNLIGVGLGPVVVGTVSDIAQANGFADALRIGLLAGMLFYPFPPVFYLFGTRHVAADIASEQSSSAAALPADMRPAAA